ncbi:mannose-1-phosphate guanylyltransferase [Candidatus Parcubacteria bacterium]|jgi:mannose-1-phosphate guanylyltransferase|nr:mannose-1-phosphate guanylyltransferase [Candidatus Parcubacteria bacterium]
MLYPVILAGGIGSRLWPISNSNQPKQFRALLNDKTLLQNTYQRIIQGFDPKSVFVTTNSNMAETVIEQLGIKQQQLFVEPIAKGTAIAIGLAALRLTQIDKEAILVTINSDHYIKDEKAYIKTIKQAGKLVEKNPDKMVLVGIKPEYPETGYGYIELGKKQPGQVYNVDSFREKPNVKTAQQYIEAGNYLWNPAIFVCRAKQLLAWYKQFLPEIYQALMDIKKQKTIAAIKKIYEQVKNVSIDIGLLEKMSDMLVIPADFGWADIGHWRSLRDVQLVNKGDGNVTNSQTVLLESNNNLLYSFSGKLVTTIGVHDMILVETEDVLFLCPADRVHEIKELSAEIKSNNLDKYL